MKRSFVRLAAACVAAGLVALAVPAAAHVSVSSSDATPGGYGKATFRVPNESDSAATTKLEITLPVDTPFAHLTVAAKPGWKVNVVKQELPSEVTVGGFTLTEAVRTVTWTATGDGIGVGQFDEFSISGGPFPDADAVTFAAKQTYDDGEVSDWSQIPEGGKEPDKPAPTLDLLPGSSDGHGHGSDSQQALAAGEHAGDADRASEASEVGAWLGGAALIVAVAALVVSLRQNRRRA